MLKIALALLLGLVGLHGLRLLSKAVRGIQQARASTQWPKTEGIVVRTDEIRNDLAYSARAIVRYTPADGKTYSTDRISFGETLKPFDRLDAGLQRVRYPEGSKVGVSYHPSQPWTAVLHPGLHSEDFRPAGVACAFLLPMLLCLWRFPVLARSWISIIAAAFAGLICGAGVLALSSGLQEMYYGYESRTWPVTTGEVSVNAGIQAAMHRQGKGDYTIYPPGLLYRYEVAGTQHVNSIRRFRSVRQTGEQEAQAIAPADLPVGTRVSISYFPTDPDISVLDAGVDGDAFILPGIGIVALSLGLAAFIWIVPALRRP